MDLQNRHSQQRWPRWETENLELGHSVGSRSAVQHSIEQRTAAFEEMILGMESGANFALP